MFGLIARPTGEYCQKCIKSNYPLILLRSHFIKTLTRTSHSSSLSLRDLICPENPKVKQTGRRMLPLQKSYISYKFTCIRQKTIMMTKIDYKREIMEVLYSEQSEWSKGKCEVNYKAITISQIYHYCLLEP